MNKKIGKRRFTDKELMSPDFPDPLRTDFTEAYHDMWRARARRDKLKQREQRGDSFADKVIRSLLRKE